MDIQGFVALTGAKLLTENADTAREILSGYSCDLLSWVMAHGKAGMAWITVQTHMNVVAVATLMDMAAISMCEQAGLPILVFNFKRDGNIERAIAGQTLGTLVTS